MRNVLILLIGILMSGCSDSIEDNLQNIQGEYNGVFFRSKAASAHIDDNGYLIIEGSTTETLKLQVENPDVGVYDILDSNNNEGFFITQDSQLYVTEGENTGGKIEIEEITDNSVTGNFYFDARLNGVGERLNFQKGVFFEVPFENPNINDDSTSDNFQAAVDGADFNADVTETTLTDNILNISGIQSDIIIDISFPADLEPGDYDISMDGNQNATYTQGDNAESAVDGSLTIDASNENQLSGSFSFTTENGIEVTDGIFEVEL